ncbi:helix-turn-helix domain-containing protein, partial [Mycobacterium canetti]
MLACAQGLTNKQVADPEHVSQPTVGKWRRRFVEARCDGLVAEPRPGWPAVATMESTPPHATHWSRASTAQRSDLSKSTIGRIWKAFELQPHRSEHDKLSNDPLFVEKVYDVVGLYLDPPESAMVPDPSAGAQPAGIPDDARPPSWTSTWSATTTAHTKRPPSWPEPPRHVRRLQFLERMGSC